MPNKMKRCPFCYWQATLQFATKSFSYMGSDGRKHTSASLFTVGCDNPMCGCKIGIYEEPEMAIKAWNRRVNDG